MQQLGLGKDDRFEIRSREIDFLYAGEGGRERGGEKRVGGIPAVVVIWDKRK